MEDKDYYLYFGHYHSLHCRAIRYYAYHDVHFWSGIELFPTHQFDCTSYSVPFGAYCFVTVLFGGTAIGQFTGYVTYGLAWLMNHAVGWIEQLPGSVTQVHINAWMVLLLYAAIVMGWLTMHKSLWWLLGVASTMIGFCILFTV